MRHTNYYCSNCFKTYSEYWDGNYNRWLDGKGMHRVPKDHPLTTGICDNTDESNHLIKDGICGGKLEVD